PSFGGGVPPVEPDPSYPIRGTAIRGQLQFWWRATRGAVCETTQALIKQQAATWGTTEQASPVEIEVRDGRVPEPRPCVRYEWKPPVAGGQGRFQVEWQPPLRVTADPRENPLPYVLFPFQG